MFKRILMAAALLLVALPANAMQTYSSNAMLVPQDSDTINNYALTANTAQTVTWPTNAQVVNITCAANYFTSLQSGITVPAANNTAGTGAALNTAQRHKGNTETAFYLISATTQVCSAEFWSN